MRDIKRIPKVLSVIESFWGLYPDMRFFQFIEYIESMVKEELKKEDLFYLEDDQLIEFLNKKLGSSTDPYRLPEEWARRWKLIILDDDGWHDKPFDEMITEREFYERATISTCSGDLGSFELFEKSLKKRGS
jgi:uncharacterized protein YihD (DUF1040 family)